jgi:Calx-beta domain
MTRLRWRIAAVAAVLLVPVAGLVVMPTAGYADGDPQISTDGTICWERRAPKDPPPFVTVTLSKALDQDLTVVMNTQDGTATAPADYAAIVDLTVTIPAGELSVQVPLRIVADDKQEPDEYFLVYIDKPSQGTITQGKAEVVIKDGAPPGTK